MKNIKYQNYKHYKLPITLNPLDYGKLILNIGKQFVIQVNRTNMVLITQLDNFNQVKLFKEGDFIFEYKDIKINDDKFIRSLNNNKFTFENHILTLVEKPIIRVIHLIIFLSPFIILFILLLQLDNFLVNNTEYLILGTNIIKLRKTSPNYKWEDLNFNVKNKLFSQKLFLKIFDQFWNKIVKDFTENNHMFILFKIKYVSGQTLSIGKVQRLNNNDKNWYSEFISNYIELKGSFYKETPIESLIFSYGFKEGKVENKASFNKDVQYQNYKDNSLVISMNPLDFGIISDRLNLKDYIYYILQNQFGQIIHFKQFENYNEVELKKSGITLFKFRDELISDNKFMRMLDNKKFYFKDNREVLKTVDFKTKFISKTKNVKTLTNNFITIDIETIINNGLLTPYLIAFYDGKNLSSYYLSDFESVEQMMLTCLKSILIRKYDGYKIYAHNLAKFDVIFLLKYLVKLGTIKPIIHSGKIISLTVNYGENGSYKIEFKDSLLLLLGSLESLSKSFKVEDKKSIFPHLFVNENNLDYIGNVPTFNNFMEVKEDQYNDYKSKFNNNWNLKDEAIKYNGLDVISLYQVLTKFNSMIFDLFAKNIHFYPTLSSLAFAIFRSNFMVENTIPQLSGKIADDIRSGYTGCDVDMYIPESPNGVIIKAYDVNSLYPSQMQSQLLPTGMPTYFNGNILKIDENAFGFFYCKITAPDDIKHPILQTRVKVNGISKTIAPIGTWEDMLFSEEMKNAIKYGYNFDILWGYTFESKNIFKEYVEFLYNLRSQYPKNDPMNFIAKILLNSLYGRFGMDENFDNINVIHKDYYSDFENKFIDQITNKIEIDDYIMVFYNSSDNLNEDQEEHNVSVSIAAAITAYSRIHMTQFKNNPNINLYYSDTDSIYTDSELDSSFIDSKILGKLKLEHVCKRAIFLTPKVYCLETIEGEFIYKIKGLKKDTDLSFQDFEKLLIKNSIKKNKNDNSTSNNNNMHFSIYYCSFRNFYSNQIN